MSELNKEPEQNYIKLNLENMKKDYMNDPHENENTSSAFSKSASAFSIKSNVRNTSNPIQVYI
jgi:hypothetical protein